MKRAFSLPLTMTLLSIGCTTEELEPTDLAGEALALEQEAQDEQAVAGAGSGPFDDGRRIRAGGPDLAVDIELGAEHGPSWDERDPPSVQGGCPSLYPSTELFPVSTELNEACMTWQAAKPDCYTYLFVREDGPLTLEPVLIDVAYDQVLGARDVEGRPLEADDYGTMDDLFFEIADLLNQDPFAFIAEWEGDTGVPLQVYVDFHQDLDDDTVHLAAALQREL